MSLTEDDREFIREVVQETLLQTGIDPESAIEAQADFRFLRQMRKTCDSAMSKVVTTIVGLLVMAILAALGFNAGKKIVGG